MGDEARKKLYEDLTNILDLYSGWLYDDLLRNIGWGIIQLLVWINDWIEGVATKVITLGGLYDSEDMSSFVDILQPLAIGLFVVSVTVLGFMFMLNKVEKRNEIIMNVLIAVSVIVILPSLMGMMEDLLHKGLDRVDVNGNISDNVLKRNIADLKYYFDSDFNYADGLNKNTEMGDENTLPHPPHPTNKEIGTSNYYYANKLKNPDLIDVTEKLDIYEDEGWFNWTTEDWVKELTNEEKDFLKHRLVQNGDGTTRIVKLSENTVPATNLGQQSYYRYHVNWAIAISILAVTGFALIITTLKIGRAMFDLAFHQIYAMFTASTDITGGQRLKKVLTEIASTFAVIFVMIVLLKLFIIYAQWANDLEQEIGIVGVIILLIAGAWALIDAPDIVQRTMGIDAGLRSGWQTMMGAYASTKMAGAGASMVGKGAGKVVKTGGKTAGGIGAGGVGVYKGMKDGMRNNNVKPVPPREPNQETSRNERQFSTNTINKSNIMEPKTGTSTNGTSTVPSKPNTSIPSRPSGSPASTIPINTSNVSAGDGGSSKSEVGGKSSSASQHKPVVNAGRRGHIYPQRNHTLIGGNRSVQRASHFLSRAHNTGYDIGQRVSQFKGNVQQAKQIKIEKRGLKTNDIRNTERD
ncbi:pLS20_p028 family conjugation system transmembrane protein [Oceanobacillus sp. CF4.6]|uniref:pLS20_p028 family conjugation system transmembrane protein n=1 Tax=Oceanobacillus sp. CF4.6 TaxID=3373080 RepID=UPI003EE659B2